MERKNSQVEITYDKLARMQVAQGTQWGRGICQSFQDQRVGVGGGLLSPELQRRTDRWQCMDHWM